jgi:hypothetical protein
MADAIARAIIEMMDDDELLEEFKQAIKDRHYSPMGRAFGFSASALEEELRKRLSEAGRK